MLHAACNMCMCFSSLISPHSPSLSLSLSVADIVLSKWQWDIFFQSLVPGKSITFFSLPLAFCLMEGWVLSCSFLSLSLLPSSLAMPSFYPSIFLHLLLIHTQVGAEVLLRGCTSLHAPLGRSEKSESEAKQGNQKRKYFHPHCLCPDR